MGLLEGGKEIPRSKMGGIEGREGIQYAAMGSWVIICSFEGHVRNLQMARASSAHFMCKNRRPGALIVLPSERWGGCLQHVNARLDMRGLRHDVCMKNFQALVL
jgi:hypothetical protein